ncbi:immunoglobulin-like domain-containing protein [Paenibacillus abyssi]
MLISTLLPIDSNFAHAAHPGNGNRTEVKVDGGGSHSLALKPDGTVVAWGNNDYGQTDVPAELNGVVAISAGWSHSLALKSDGTVVAWGLDIEGQTDIPAELNGVVAISAGWDHSLALKSDGTVAAWGNNVSGKATVPAGLNGVVAISAGWNHSMALKSDGTVVAWGSNDFNLTTMAAGLNGVVAISAGGNHSLALKSDGTVVAWGSNGSSQATVPAGLNGVTAISGAGDFSLAIKSDGTVVAWGENRFGQTTVPAGLNEVMAISAGYHHSLALKSDGTVVAWGNNSTGRTTVPAGFSLPVKGDRIAAGGYHSLALNQDGTVVAWGKNIYGQTIVPGGLNGVVAIAAGLEHSLALKSNGTVAAWGDNSFGQTTVPGGLNGVAAIAAGGYHSLALKSDGTAAVWGDNYYGQTNMPVGLNGVVAITAGLEHSLALKQDGTVVAWGRNNYGQTTVPGGLNGVVAIAAGLEYSLALKSDGTVVAFGNNSSGQTTVPGSASLGGLSLQEGAFYPAFHSSVSDYVYSYIGPTVSSVHVTATLADPSHGTMFINNELQSSGVEKTIDVTGPSTVISVRVEPYFLPGKTYTITVLRDSTAPDVQFSENGNAAPAQTAATLVTVSDTESGVDSASTQYVWTQSTAVPASGWTSFTSGDTLTQTSGDGNWYLHTRATDRAGNTVDQVSGPFVLDNTAPSLVLIGSNPMDVPAGQAYVEPGAIATDTTDGNISASSIVITGNVNTSRAGTYPVSYQVSDHAGNTASVTRSVYVYDGEAPAIYLNGPNPMTIEVNSTFTDPGATAQDLHDGDLSSSIIVTGTVDSRTLGEYRLFYNVSDQANHAATTVIRSVYVKVTKPPVITLSGLSAMSIKVGETFADPGAQAMDAYYGDISNSITVTGSVNTQIPGTYTLHYNVQNPANISAAEVIRTITVAGASETDHFGDWSPPPSVVNTDTPTTETIKINSVDVKVKTTKETSDDGQSVIRITLEPDQLAAAFFAEPKIILEVNNSDPVVLVDLPVEPLLDALSIQPDAVVQIKVAEASYSLPVSVLNDTPKEAVITVAIAKVSNPSSAALNASIHRQGSAQLLEHPFDFSLYSNGREITNFNGTFVVRTLSLDSALDPDKSTAVWADANNELHFIPSVFSNSGGLTMATIYSPHNSTYTVIRSDKTFADLKGHWAQADIELLANKHIVYGSTADTFAPDTEITRAQFAALLVRSLGLAEDKAGNPFTDVKTGDWFAGAVETAQKAGLISGYKDGTFRPNTPITREQMVSIIARALKFVGKVPQVEALTLERFADAFSIADWAKEASSQLLAVHIIHGTADTRFAPKEYATRAQSAVMLKRMLQYLKFIN